MIYDRAREKPSAVYIFEALKGKVTALKYGPYDNGHIVVGFDSGIIAILDTISLKKLFERQIFEYHYHQSTLYFLMTRALLYHITWFYSF